MDTFLSLIFAFSLTETAAETFCIKVLEISILCQFGEITYISLDQERHFNMTIRQKWAKGTYRAVT